MIGWQGPSNIAPPTSVASASDAARLSWSTSAKTYLVDFQGLASGKLAYAFPGTTNHTSFKIEHSDGSFDSLLLSLDVLSTGVGRMYWQTDTGVTPRMEGEAIFGLALPAATLPTTGSRVFVTDTSPQASIVIDLATRKVSGSMTTVYSDAWGPYNTKDRGVLTPTDLLPDGSFTATLTVDGAPRTGILRGQIFGPGGHTIGLYWDAPVRAGYDTAGWTDWRITNAYPDCNTCSP